MITIGTLRKRVIELRDSIDELSVEAISETREQLLAANRDQLYDGKNREGKDITPSYLDDPHFKSREAAQRYSDWKDAITPNANRSKGTPNLYIIGTYHNSIKITTSGLSLIYSAAFRGSSIESKYGPLLYGLGGSRKKTYNENVLKPVLFRLLKTKASL